MRIWGAFIPIAVVFTDRTQKNLENLDGMVI